MSAESPLKLLLAARRIPGTGNFTTSNRIADIFRSLGCDVELVDYDDFKGNHVDVCRFDLVVVLHAFHGYEVLLECKSRQIPFVIILGGTDVNCFSDSPKRHLIGDFLENASAIVAFNNTMREKLCEVIPTVHSKISIIAQSCDVLSDTTVPNKVGSSEADSEGESDSPWRQKLGYSLDNFLVLLPASIRAVKAPHFILEQFQQYQTQRNSKACLIIVGPVLEQGYLQQHPMLDNIVKKSSVEQYSPHAPPPVIRYLSPLPREHFLSLLSEADVVLNTSESEGECGAILEAMFQQVPVVARDNSGNCALVSHRHSGWLFHTPEECISLLEEICQQKDGVQTQAETSRGNVVENAKRFVESGHSKGTETALYRDMLSNVLKM